ncbi:MAG: FAD-dependent oxidoreductase [Deltaproteobacteria bacterium]|nr:FAD-dependent oxidoreductase [Deltaproteobacteria bacterium]
MVRNMKRFWEKQNIKTAYDMIIIGGGLHGLAAAYFLARDHGITNVAVIEKNCIGYGGSGRNTCIVRADQRTSDSVLLHKEALDLWPQLIDELDYNLMFSQSGSLGIVHSEDAYNELQLSTFNANYHGLATSMLDAKECKEIIPELDISSTAVRPVLGGQYHDPAGTVRHDAVVWALARGASRLGIHIHQQCEIKGIRTRNNEVVGVETSLGVINTKKVLNAGGGFSPQIAAMIDQKLPITVLQMEAMVSEPLKPFLNVVFFSFDYHCFGSQSLRGEIVTGSQMDPWPTYTSHASAQYIHHQALYLAAIMPCLKAAKFMRIWAGLTDMTPDMAPIMEGNYPVKGYFLDAGWGYFGFKSGPIAGRYMARYMATDERPRTIEPFNLRRYENYRFLGESGLPICYGPWN